MAILPVYLANLSEKAEAKAQGNMISAAIGVLRDVFF
jgi:hypothetical protein